VRYIIVGHPLRLDGEAGEMAGEAARFARKLSKETGIETELIDERLSSWEAEQTMGEAQSGRAGKPSPLDEIAAAILLRDYLDRRKK